MEGVIHVFFSLFIFSFDFWPEEINSRLMRRIELVVH